MSHSMCYTIKQPQQKKLLKKILIFENFKDCLPFLFALYIFEKKLDFFLIPFGPLCGYTKHRNVGYVFVKYTYNVHTIRFVI